MTMKTSRRLFLSGAGAIAASTMLSSAAGAQDVIADILRSSRRGNWDDQFDARASEGGKVQWEGSEHTRPIPGIAIYPKPVQNPLPLWIAVGGTPNSVARAAYYVGRLPEPKSGVEAVAGMLSVIRNAAQPFRVPDPDKPYASQTIWQTVGDLTGKRYVFASTTRPNVLWVDLSELDFAEGALARKLDLLGDTALEGGLGGNVTDRFVDTAPLQFLELPAAQ